MLSTDMSIAENIHRVTMSIGEAASKTDRNPDDITLIAVSKTRSVDEIREAADAGVMHFGENRVQEASGKLPDVDRDVTWHLIGPLQSNKAGRAVELFDWIGSIHSVKIAGVIARHSEKSGRKPSVLIQVNISGEEAKSGVSPDKVRTCAIHALNAGLNVRGLMTIGSFGATISETRKEFADMHSLYEKMREDPVVGSHMTVLSMGMSGDYAMAIEEGATMVRVGTAIFGARN
ncbi:YggS family pyridoxal phosphate-dependent enzyme [Candidatus Latescibacterota bacterium]